MIYIKNGDSYHTTSFMNYENRFHISKELWMKTVFFLAYQANFDRALNNWTEKENYDLVCGKKDDADKFLIAFLFPVEIECHVKHFWKIS